jgi:hypothetical protein
LVEVAPGDLLGLDEKDLVLMDLLWAEQVGRLAEVLGENDDCSDIDLDGVGRVVA